MVSDGEIRMTHVRSCDNIADILTKPLSRGDSSTFGVTSAFVPSRVIILPMRCEEER